jgi:hypothetical protein
MITLLITLLFWPLMIASVIGSFFVILNKSYRTLYISALIIIPMSLYLAAMPRFQIWGLIFPLFYLGSAMCIRKNKYILAFSVNLPVYLVIGWLGYVVLSQ